MLRQGPIPHFIHGLIEYAASVLMILAPFLLAFDSNAASALSIVAGVLVLVLAASSHGPTSLINSIPIATHVLLDYALAGVLIAAPFLFGFSGEGAPTAFFIGLGVAHLLVTIGTRFRPAPEAP
ncbi:MAG: SPW repeat domain-containing protein, partial [Solirubrobacteraceae bacterium]